MRRHLSYANITATLALVFAMSGGAIAANHYLINSTKQISPKVLKKLKGSPGKPGASGANGAPGTTGAQGPAGKEGTPGKDGIPGKEGTPGKEGAYPVTLPSGKSESGNYAVAAGDSKEGFMAQGFAFPVPLAGALDESHVAWLSEGTTNSHCSGVGHAAAGFLCVYEDRGANDTPNNGHAVSNSTGNAGADPGGFMLFFDVTKAEAFSYGSWTVTAA